MSEGGVDPPGRPLPERAGEMGEQIGRFATLGLRRIEALARTAVSREEPVRPRPDAADDGATGATDTSDLSAKRRAAELLAGMGEGLDHLAASTGPSVRRLLALGREEAEDIWAEAQHIRQSNHREPE